ncbi:hypothetical protein LAJLEIBI_02933 [[Clostridium] hylemonae DSM 15053]|nr:hypothetical protein LAJLEIBI_02933 [[Clostridium] hylemonae DSM 15053]
MKGFKSQRTIASDMQEKLCNVDKDMGRVLADDLQELPAIALGNHLALNSAFANDVDGDQVYAQQVWGYGKRKTCYGPYQLPEMHVILNMR